MADAWACCSNCQEISDRLIERRVKANREASQIDRDDLVGQPDLVPPQSDHLLDLLAEDQHQDCCEPVT